MEKIPITVIGGGVVGLSIVNVLLDRGYKDILLLEKNEAFGREQSDRNSGVIHCGVYYNPGSLMAKLCVEGNPLLYNFAEKHGVPNQRTGKLIVATNEEEDKILDTFLQRGMENAVPGINKLTKKEVSNIEPNVRAISALHCPTTGIISSADYVKTLEKVIASKHNEKAYLMKNQNVIGIEPKSGYSTVHVRTTKGKTEEWEFDTDMLINSAGLFAVDIAKMVNLNTPYEKAYLRGEYNKFYSTRRSELDIKSNIYPTPRTFILKDGVEFFDFGIHLTPTFETSRDGKHVIGREVWVGPKFEDTNNPADRRTGIVETEKFYDQVKTFFPGIRKEDLQLSDSGVLGILNKPWDFVIYKEENHPNCIQLLGMESPALTASQAIANYVADLMKPQL